MAEPMFRPDMLGVCALGIAAVVMGLSALLLGPRRAGWRGPSLLALALGAGSAVALAAGEPGFAWQPAALGAAWALFALARSAAGARLGGALGLLLGRAQGQGALLLVAGGALLAWQAAHLEREAAAHDLGPHPGGASLAVEVVPAGGPSAVTDAGNPVPLFGASCSGEGPVEEEASALVRRHALEQLVIQTAPAGLDCNCHGWVFAAGRHWVRGEAIEKILQDNRYQPVASPRPGNLAVFRDAAGAVVHSGLVRVAAGGGLLLIESKWCRLGRYVHGPADHLYHPCSCSFYHTPRGGHRLRGLPGAPAANGTSAPSPGAPVPPGA